MKQFTPELKHHILQQYRPYTRAGSFEALARRYAVEGGGSTIQKWHSNWNGTAASLKRKAVSGRPRKLSTAQVNRHIQTRIVAANRRSQAVHYPALLPAVQAATRSNLALRTLQRYGQEAGVKQKRAKKRKADESKCSKVNN
jgi:flagellar hook protein FlgE